MLKKSNKGAALVTILIAITFVSIIATTLLTISLNNYQMKVVNTRSKANFYVAEQNLNIVTANIRNCISNPSLYAGTSSEPLGLTPDADACKNVLKLVGGSNTATSYEGELLARLVFPNEVPTAYTGGAYVTDSSNAAYMFSDGAINVEHKSGGDKVTLKDVTVKRIEGNDFGDTGCENSIKTDITFYIQKPAASTCDVGVGDCSFLLDNSINFGGSDTVRANVYGSCIIGDYKHDAGKNYSYIKRANTNLAVDGSSFVTGDVTHVNSFDGSVINLNGKGNMNMLAPYTCVFGDIAITDQALLNVYKGSFTVYGNIFVKTGGAFVCNGDLYLAPGCYIYYVDNSNNCTKVTASDKTKNIIFSSLQYLSDSEVSQQLTNMHLDDNDENNDGVLSSILVKNDGFYCYELCKDNQYSEDLKMNGKKYNVKIPEQNFNGDYRQCLVFVPESYGESGLQENAPDCTIISKNPVKITQTHNINLSQIGGDVFNYYLDNTSIFKAKANGSIKTFNVGGFFSSDCNDKVKMIFQQAIPNSGGSGAGSGVADTGVEFSNWVKF